MFFFLFTFSGILTPNDEFQFWIEQTHRGNKRVIEKEPFILKNYLKQFQEYVIHIYYMLRF